ncbi:cruciferin-like [Brassica napus]|uniref:cruciferin-like n=1 Tax=Brassica napus TaxID=3708 RepID=UPI002078EEC9|nr:cruciferin-like [Brassica napus]
MHQKVEHIRSGDTIATHPGVAQWFYNNRNQTLVIVAVMDLASHQNQLDRNPRNAMVLPQWNANANAVLYVTDGEAQIQVVNDNGDRVFDGQVSQRAATFHSTRILRCETRNKRSVQVDRIQDKRKRADQHSCWTYLSNERFTIRGYSQWVPNLT